MEKQDLLVERGIKLKWQVSPRIYVVEFNEGEGWGIYGYRQRKKQAEEWLAKLRRASNQLDWEEGQPPPRAYRLVTFC